MNVKPSTPPAEPAPMRVLEAATYRGANLYADTPIIRIRIDLGALEERPTSTLPDFADRLLAALPGLGDHGCSLGVPGGFVERLREGTWLGHVAEHVALELQALAGSDVTRGKTRSVEGRPGVYDMFYAYEDEEAGRLAGALALALVDSLLPGDLRGILGLELVSDAPVPAGLEAGLEALRRQVARGTLGPTTRALVAEARRRGIPVMRLDGDSLIQLGTGRHQRRIRASVTSGSSHIAVEAASDKELTKALLADVGVPVPRGMPAATAEEALEAARRIGGPVVTKPLDGNHGRGVSVGLTGEAEIRDGWARAARHGGRVIVEEAYAGRDYRLLVVGGAVVAAAERVPAHVVGDGRRSIAALVEEVNRDTRRGEGHERAMTRITLDEEACELLARDGLAPESVPEAGRTVRLCAAANLSKGGAAVDRTDEVHPHNAELACRAALAIGLDVAGVDIVAPDIAHPLGSSGGGVVEVNAAPGFRMHLEPSEGRPRQVARPVLRMLFPEGAPTGVPILAVTGTNGKSTTVRMLVHILRQAGLKVGHTSTSGIYVDGRRIVEADASGPRSARTLLRDPTIDVAVLETARGGILREGLGFEACDVGAVLNVTADHLGLGGIDAIEQLAAVKSVVVRAVRRGGVSVLNADDPLTAAMAGIAGGRPLFFSCRGGEASPALAAHIAAGGLAAVCEAGPRGPALVLHDGDERHCVMAAADIPATLGGIVGFNVENALAAAGMAYAHGVPVATIRSALAGFTNSFEHNPGRLNVFDGHGFRVIVDYAHNPAGLRALLQVVEHMRPSYGRVIGCLGIPGDRRDDDIREMGAIGALAFDAIVFREQPDARGRAPGELNALLRQGAVAAGFPPRQIRAFAGEDEAVSYCLSTARPRDLVVLMPTEYERIWQQVLAFEPRIAAEAPAGPPGGRARPRGVPPGLGLRVNGFAEWRAP